MRTKSNFILIGKVAVVATVTQQMDQDGQLVVCIEPTENDADDASSNDTLPQAALAEEQTTVVDDNCELNVQLGQSSSDIFILLSVAYPWLVASYGDILLDRILWSIINGIRI